MKLRAYKLTIVGLVQGVGFRPFIHRIAVKSGVRGYVRNVGGSEVEAWIEGSDESVERFMELLKSERPKPAIIDEVFVEEVEPRGYGEFKILSSSTEVVARSNIPPDLAVCSDCLREVLDPSSSRYRYPFNSCAWCGPRYSYMYRAPYDRENTAMRKYELCESCSREYRDIENARRYHAQGISCPRDGPRLELVNSGDWSRVEARDPIAEAAKLIDEGFIVAIKGIGGYHIAALATSDDVVLELRRRKRRPYKPFAVMGLNVEVLEKVVYMEDSDRELLGSPQSPILLLPKRPDSPVSKHVSPGLSREGVFVAYTPLHYLLLMETRDKFSIMTSGNIHGEPMCIDEDCVKSKLRGVVDYVLTHDREIVNRVDDSVLRKTLDKYVFLRRSRGYAPQWIRVNRDLGGEFIGFGSDLNNVPGLGFENKVALSQYIGDLDSASAQEDLLKYVEFLVKNYRVDPSRATVVVDKHPAYASRKLGYEYGERQGSRVVEVQHHYAHAVGALFEAGLRGRHACLVIDGLGWGDDDTVWGGEVLIVDSDSPKYSRVASIKQLPLTSDRDSIYPLRLLAGLLAVEKYDWSEIARVLSVLGVRGDELVEYFAVYRMVNSEMYVPASSTGRLIDLVSAVLGVCRYRSYEGEPAIRLEAAADGASERVSVPQFRISRRDGLHELDYVEIVEWLIDSRDNYRAEDLARGFLYSLGYWYGELVVSSVRGLRLGNTVLLSGGAAVNSYIAKGLRDRLAEDQLNLYIPLRIPVNDEGISFGQIVAASLALAEEARDRGQ